MKKLCFVITDAISFNVLMKGQLEYLKSKGHEITLVCGGGKQQIDDLKKRNVGVVKYINFSREVNLWRDLYCLIQLSYYLIFNRFDSVIYSTPKALLLTSLASFISLQKNRICIFRGRAYENYTGLAFKFFSVLDYLSIKLSSKVFFISNSLKEQFVKEALIRADVANIVASGSSNGISSSFFENKFDEEKLTKLKKLINYSQKDFIIVFVGRHCLEKGIVEWEQIINNLQGKGIKFISAGQIEDEVAKGVINDLCRLDNYYYLGHTSVRELFEISDIHLFLSYREGFGNVAIEAAATGVPTLGYDVVGVKDSVSGVSGTLFKKYDVKNISSEIIRLLRDGNLEKSYDKKAMKAWVAANFNQEYLWNEYEKQYTK